MINIISIIIVPLPKLSKIYLRMAKSTKLEISLLNLRLIHFVTTGLASIIVSGHYWFATYHTGWEIASASSA
jgi:hypothetical protein